MFDVIIVGGGASGLYAAKELKEKKVMLIEKNNSLGFKLSISGKSQCNFTHAGDIKEFYDKYGLNKKFVKQALYSHTNSDVIKYFRDNGVDTLIREDGKVFPKSLNSKDVISAISNDIRGKVKIKLDESVKNIVKEEDFFIVQTTKESYKSKNVIIATGGLSYPVTGSTGDGYKILKRLNHNIIDPKLALTPVFVSNFKLIEAAGISFKSIDIIKKDKDGRIEKYVGDVLITHKGLSGPGIIDNSRYFKSGDTLELNLINMSANEVEKMIIDYIDEHGKKQVLSLFELFDMPKRVFEILLAEWQIEKDTKLSEINKIKRKIIVQNLTAYKCIISSLGDYHIAMVTAGGLDLNEVNPKTMQSRLIDGLYILGELLDIDGNTGGYNIQWAFSSAYLAAQNIKKI